MSLLLPACGASRSPAGKDRGRAVRPTVVEPKLITPPIRAPALEPPRLVPVMLVPAIVLGPRQIDAFMQENAVVDILWVVDNSCSMTDKRARLATQFDRFLSVLIGAGVDYHIGVTSGNIDPPGDGGRLRGPMPWIDRTTRDPEGAFRIAVTFPLDRNIVLFEALGAMARALTPPLIEQQNAGFLRDEASLAVIAVGASEDRSIGPTGYFLRLLRGLKGPGREVNISFSAIVGDQPSGCTPAGQELVFGATARAGTRDIEVARATGGLVESVCTADFGPFVDRLATALTGLRRVFPLSAPPRDRSIEVRVNGSVVPKDDLNGWSYVSGQRAIRFNGTSIPRPGSDVRIIYEVAV